MLGIHPTLSNTANIDGNSISNKEISGYVQGGCESEIPAVDPDLHGTTDLRPVPRHHDHSVLNSTQDSYLGN